MSPYRWRPVALPCADEDFDGDLRVSRVEGPAPYWCASGPLAWRGTSRESPDDAARDFARQTARHFGALTLAFPDGHTERFGDAEASIAETFARAHAAADAAVTGHALRVMGGEGEPASAWRNAATLRGDVATALWRCGVPWDEAAATVRAAWDGAA